MTEFKWKQRAYDARNPEKFEARKVVATAIKSGTLANPKTLLCADCLTPAREYDHYLGYALEHRLDVQPVCRSCHVEREKRRRPNCKRGHKYTERDWIEVDGRKRRKCHACEQFRKKNPDFERVDGRGMKRGAQVGEGHPQHRLTEADVRQIRVAPMSQRKLAVKYGVSFTTIQAIQARRTWKHVE